MDWLREGGRVHDCRSKGLRFKPRQGPIKFSLYMVFNLQVHVAINNLGNITFIWIRLENDVEKTMGKYPTAFVMVVPKWLRIGVSLEGRATWLKGRQDPMKRGRWLCQNIIASVIFNNLAHTSLSLFGALPRFLLRLAGWLDGWIAGT